MLAALAPVALFWPTLGHGFLLDDTVLFQRGAGLDDLASIPRGFLLDVGGLRKGTGTVISSFYRPVFLALSTLYHHVAGGQPGPWHGAAVALAGLCGLLACGLLLRLGLPPLLALLASLVFSLHPAHVSSVAWASGLQELLAACFSLAALHAALWRLGEEADGTATSGTPASAGIAPANAPLSPARAVVAGVAFACALLSKEVAIALLPFVAVWALGVRQSDPPLSRRLGRAAALFAGVAALYLAARVAVLGGLAQPAIGAPSVAHSLAAVPVAFATYLRLLLWPSGFSFFRPERPDLALLSVPVLLALAAVAVLAALAVWAWRRRNPLWLPIAWFAAWILPVLNIWALPPSMMVTDRYLFLPALALPWAVAVAVPRRVATAVLAVLAVAWAVLAWRYSAIFASEGTFLAAMEKAAPTSPMVFEEKGRLLLAAGRATAARTALERAVALDPTAPGALLDLGDLDRRDGDLAAAERRYRQALVARPEESRAWKALVVDLARYGQRAHATALAEEGVRRWPQDFQTALLAALLRRAGGQRQAAAAAFAAACRLRPHDPAIAGGMDAALDRLQPLVLPTT